MNTKTLLASACALLAAASLPAQATEYGAVISRVPAYASVAVPERQCFDQEQTVRQAPTGAGALVGALVGGGVGNALGNGAGRAAATGLGFIAGALIGDRVEAEATPPASAVVRSCQVVSRVENRVVGWDVVYEYNGQRYATRLAADPGDRVALNVSVAPVAAAAATVVPAPAVAYTQTVVPAPAVVYAPAAYYVVPSVSFGWGRRWR
jgi:uncharacterized protein YcfJ